MFIIGAILQLCSFIFCFLLSGIKKNVFSIVISYCKNIGDDNKDERVGKI